MTRQHVQVLLPRQTSVRLSSCWLLGAYEATVDLPNLEAICSTGHQPHQLADPSADHGQPYTRNYRDANCTAHHQPHASAYHRAYSGKKLEGKPA